MEPREQNMKSTRILRFAARGVLAAFLFGAALSELTPLSPADTDKYEVTVERNVAAKMRDGVTLRADIHRPKADGRFPVLLVRTPYDKQGIMTFGLRAAKQIGRASCRERV